MPLHYQNTDPIMLGSGELYLIKSSEIADPSALTAEEEAQLVNVGAIDSGASITINKSYIDVNSANRGKKVMRFVNGTEVSFKTGIITFVMGNLANFIYGVTMATDTSTKTNKFVIGNEAAPIVYLRFVHTDSSTGKTLTVNIYKCQFKGDQEINFESENPTVINYEFEALATQISNSPCYVEFIEYDPNMVVEEEEEEEESEG